MPIRAKDLLKATRKIEVEFQGQTLAVEYRVNAVTPAFFAEVEGWSDKDVLQRGVCAVVQSWDLLDENDQALPVTMETTEGLPVEFLRKVQEAVMADMRGGDEEKKV